MVKMKLFWNSKTVFSPPLNMQLKKASLIKYCFKILTQENKTMLKRKLEGNSSVLKIQT